MSLQVSTGTVNYRNIIYLVNELDYNRQRFPQITADRLGASI